MRVEEFLENSARQHPHKVALVANNSRLTYAELNQSANRFAHALRLNGVQRDDRVVVFLDNSTEAVVGIFGALKASAVFSVINPTTKPEKLAYILNNCRAIATLTHARLLAPIGEALKSVPWVKTTFVVEAVDKMAIPGAISFEQSLEDASSSAQRQQGIDMDLAMIIYTSGSTGMPKGVMMTHANVDAAATSITTYLENTSDDVILNALPLAFDYGLYQVLMSCKLGGTIVLEKSFAFPYQVLQRIDSENVTGFPIVPTMAAILLQLKDLSPGRFPHLRYITNTAAALPVSHISRLQKLFPMTRIFSMYGLTECKRCTYLPPEQLSIRPDSVGVAIPNTEACVVNDLGEPVKPGEVGTLVIRGDHIMKGYWENPEATDRMLRPGRYPWEKVLYTGDLFRADDDGYLYFVGRSDDIIKSRGEKVSPTEVENVIYKLPSVSEVAVIGLPDPILGTAIKAVIVPVTGATLDEHEILSHCSKHLEDYMVPKFVEFRSNLPKTDSGKIRRRAVQEESLSVESTR